jgi:EAL domain-containing protein (putative c-di-GMP-specific phosphodiesterase class I)
VVELLGARVRLLINAWVNQPVTHRPELLVASTIALAHSLNLRMVAEGVENNTAHAELERLGCDQAQGYYMSRPVPAAELEHWLSTWRGDDEPTDARTVALSYPLTDL